MANKTGGNYRALYVPEQLSRETYNSLLQEPSIQEVLTLISHANCGAQYWSSVAHGGTPKNV